MYCLKVYKENLFLDSMTDNIKEIEDNINSHLGARGDDYN